MSSSSTSRRDFLKILGLSGAGAAATACSPPETTDKLLPYLIAPEDIPPGESVLFATTLTRAGAEPLPVHAWVRDGRVIQLEANRDFPTGGSGLPALARSSLQDLYDPDRFPGPRRAGEGSFTEVSWEDGLAAAGEAVASGTTVLLTDGATGSREEFYGRWARDVGVEHVSWEPLSHRETERAHEIVFGRAEIPEYALERADRIVSFGADFLGSWLAPAELAGRYAEARDVDAGRLAKFTFVSPRLDFTGTSADEWLPARPGTVGLVALAAARVVADRNGTGGALSGLLADYTPESVAERTGLEASRIRTLGEEIADAERPVALPPGSAGRDGASTDAHVAVAVLNAVAGAAGETLRFGVGPVRPETATVEEMADLARRLRDGEVTTLIVAGANPVYDLPEEIGFAEALEAATVIALTPHPDETASAADWVLPSSHELESWGDAEVRPGTWALTQPVMRPVFDTRQREDVLLGIAGAAGYDPREVFGAPDFGSWLRDRWREKHADAGASLPFERWWERALQRGGWWEQAATPMAAGVAPAAAGHTFDFPAPGSADDGFELVVYPSVQFYDGRGANRSWMQELPDPVTQAVWSSWVEMHPETAEPLGLERGDVVELRTPAGTVRAPVYLYEGIRPDTVAVPMGQGHTAYGRYAEGRGVNPARLFGADARSGAGALALGASGVSVTATGEHTRLVVAQGSDSDHGREVAELMEAGAAREAVEAHEVDLGELVEAAWDSDPNSPYRWGMTIDLNACTGCGACVTACYAENNLAVVGEEKFAEGREMSWLRLERYFEETADGGFRTVHEPMLCQHCGDAPCEPVCPVYATYHNPEGLNVQVYNRCVGTRYCSNNCPYKVRRFNWFTYDFPYPLNLQLNPDVTVRQKGVMEKCTFCVQRINRAKIDAKEEGRLVQDGEIETACQTACPTDAIVFGNLKDPTSEVSKIARGARSYHVLEELNTRPAVHYLKDVTHAELPASERGGGHGGEAADAEGTSEGAQAGAGDHGEH